LLENLLSFFLQITITKKHSQYWNVSISFLFQIGMVAGCFRKEFV